MKKEKLPKENLKSETQNFDKKKYKNFIYEKKENLKNDEFDFGRRYWRN